MRLVAKLERNLSETKERPLSDAAGGSVGRSPGLRCTAANSSLRAYDNSSAPEIEPWSAVGLGGFAVACLRRLPVLRPSKKPSK